MKMEISDLEHRLSVLARITEAPAPVVSVYLDTRWADEHQRDRVRVFVKNELARARETVAGRTAKADLEWVQAQVEAVVEQTRFPEAQGVAFFACEALGLRDALPVRTPFADKLVIAGTPYLVPLASLLERLPPAVVVFIDVDGARLIPLGADEAGHPVVLESPASPSTGSVLAEQARDRRHVEDRRRHFAAVAEALGALVEQGRAERIVIAGEPSNSARLRSALAPKVAERVVGIVAGAHYEPANLIRERAVELLGHVEDQRRAREVDAALTDAAKGNQAAAGVDETLDAVNRGAVRRLYLHGAFNRSGAACPGCGTLQSTVDSACRSCGHATAPMDLVAAMVARVVAAGGTVHTVDLHEPLARVGGVAAVLRYPL